MTDEQAWQIEAIKEGIKQADEDKFASDESVKALFDKFGLERDED